MVRRRRHAQGEQLTGQQHADQYFCARVRSIRRPTAHFFRLRARSVLMASDSAQATNCAGSSMSRAIRQSRTTARLGAAALAAAECRIKLLSPNENGNREALGPRTNRLVPVSCSSGAMTTSAGHAVALAIASGVANGRSTGKTIRAAISPCAARRVRASSREAFSPRAEFRKCGDSTVGCNRHNVAIGRNNAYAVQ